MLKQCLVGDKGALDIMQMMERLIMGLVLGQPYQGRGRLMTWLAVELTLRGDLPSSQRMAFY